MYLSLCHVPGLCPNDNAKLRHAAPALHVVAMCAMARFPPSSPASPYATRTTHVPFHAVCQPLSSFSPGAAPIGAAPAPRRVTIFLCSAAASFYAASLLTLRHTVLHSVSRIKSVVPTPKSQMEDIELLMFIIAPIGIHSSATMLFCHRR